MTKLKLVLLIQCLMLFSAMAYAFDEGDQALLEQFGLNGRKIMLHPDKWGVKPSKIDVDSIAFKDQGKSLIDWDTMNHEKWLDFNYWKQQREQRDKEPSWKYKLRQSQHVELIGKLIKCVGDCKIFRGQNSVQGEYLSRLKEGDEFLTSDDSYAWLFLTDGSLVRISPKTSLTFNEINIGKTEVFYSIRLNHGQIYWEQRKIGKFKEENLAETDLTFSPLMIQNANREYFSRKEFEIMDHDNRLKYYTRDNPGHISQFETLNGKIKKTEKLIDKINTHVFMVTPNQTFYTTNAHFDLFYSINSETHFRFQKEVENFESSDSRETSVLALKRGFTNRDEMSLEENTWYQVDKTGRETSELEDSSAFKVVDLFRKRIPSIRLAREIMLRDKFQFWFEDSIEAQSLATDFGYRLWNQETKETSDRLAYLKEYTRRIETTNLNSLAKVFKGHKVKDFDKTYYEFALNRYILKLKGLYNKDRMNIPEMNEINYYIWTLKNAQ